MTDVHVALGVVGSALGAAASDPGPTGDVSARVLVGLNDDVRSARLESLLVECLEAASGAA